MKNPVIFSVKFFSQASRHAKILDHSIIIMPLHGLYSDHLSANRSVL